MRVGVRDSPAIDSQGLAIEALRFFAAHADQAQRFFDWSGLEAGGIRQAASDPGFASGVLDYFAQNLASLERFAEAAGLEPGDVIDLHERSKTRGLTAHD